MNRASTGGVTGDDNPMGKNSLGEMIRWYKGRTKFEIRNIETRFKWQAKFYDRIIRNELELNKIRQYINDNPLKWEYEKNHVDNLFY